MSEERFDPKLHEEIKERAIRLAAKAEDLKKLVLRANNVELTSTAFDGVLDDVADLKECLEEELGVGAFDEEAVDETPEDTPSGELPEDETEEEEAEEAEEASQS
jgi:hypothetical protein